jgi:hypothetical protein
MDLFPILQSHGISSKRLYLLENLLCVYDNYGMYSISIDTSKVLVRCNGSRKKIFMTLENNMLAFTHFLRALSLHI